MSDIRNSRLGLATDFVASSKSPVRNPFFAGPTQDIALLLIEESLGEDSIEANVAPITLWPSAPCRAGIAFIGPGSNGDERDDLSNTEYLCTLPGNTRLFPIEFSSGPRDTVQTAPA